MDHLKALCETIVNRFREAGEIEKRWHVPGTRPAGYLSSWPLTVETMQDYWARVNAQLQDEETKQLAVEPPQIRPPVPSRREIDRMMQAYGWLPFASDERSRIAILARARGLPWATRKHNHTVQALIAHWHRQVLTARWLRSLHDKGIREIAAELSHSEKKTS